MSLSIKILGSGCPKCRTLEKLTSEVVQENNFNADIQKVQDIVDIMNYGVLSTPALVVNEKVVVSGRIPSKEEILNFLKSQING